MLVNKLLLIGFTLVFSSLSFFSSVFFIIPVVLFSSGLMYAMWAEETKLDNGWKAAHERRVAAIEESIKKLAIGLTYR